MLYLFSPAVVQRSRRFMQVVLTRRYCVNRRTEIVTSACARVRIDTMRPTNSEADAGWKRGVVLASRCMWLSSRCVIIISPACRECSVFEH